MLNIQGAFVLIGRDAPVAVLLSANAYAVYLDRVRVCGFDKAVSYTFGPAVTHALPCTLDCMEFIGLNYTGARTAEVRQICARIALGQPIGDGKDLTEGGQGARIDAPVKLPNAPAGIAAEREVLRLEELQS